MNILDVFHGTTGDKILQIIKEGLFRPDETGRIFFVQHDPREALQYGADSKRMARYVLRARVEVPLTANLETGPPTAGAPLHTLIVTSLVPIRAQIMELLIHKLGSSDLERVKGVSEIARVLTAK